MNTEHYKAASERTDEAERALIPAIRHAKPARTETGKAHSPLPRYQYIEGDGTAKMQIYVRSMGKLLAVVAMFDSDQAANTYCETHQDTGVVACGGGLVFVANLYDHGSKAQLPLSNDYTRIVRHVNHAQALAEALRATFTEYKKGTCVIDASICIGAREALAAYEQAKGGDTRPHNE